MAELVDALASGASALRGVEVQVLSSVPNICTFREESVFVLYNRDGRIYSQILCVALEFAEFLLIYYSENCSSHDYERRDDVLASCSSQPGKRLESLCLSPLDYRPVYRTAVAMD